MTINRTADLIGDTIVVSPSSEKTDLFQKSNVSGGTSASVCRENLTLLKDVSDYINGPGSAKLSEHPENKLFQEQLTIVQNSLNTLESTLARNIQTRPEPDTNTTAPSSS